jgi:hypothetical protein
MGNANQARDFEGSSIKGNDIAINSERDFAREGADPCGTSALSGDIFTIEQHLDEHSGTFGDVHNPDFCLAGEMRNPTLPDLHFVSDTRGENRLPWGWRHGNCVTVPEPGTFVSFFLGIIAMFAIGWINRKNIA